MEIEERLEDGLRIVRVLGRLDSLTAPVLDQFLGDLIGAGDHLILDLSKLDYISSAGLRVVLKVAKRLHASQGDLVLCGIEGVILEIFAVSGFLNFLRVEKNLSKAKSALKN